MVANHRLELYWIPLGAGAGIGARVVRASGALYEGLVGAIQRRPRRPLFHSALVAATDEGRYVIEVTPVPSAPGTDDRGVVGGGAVGSALLGRWRIFRYEIRRWLDGTIPDIAEAVDSPIVITTDAHAVRWALDALSDVPTAVWGRDELRAGEMWNSNSVVSWTLHRAGLAERAGCPPGRGRAPGWDAGIAVARRLEARADAGARTLGTAGGARSTPAR